MLKGVIFLGFVAVGLSFTIIDRDLDHTWELWKRKYSKQYSEDEGRVRRQIWEDNLHLVTKHNAEHSLGLHSYTLGMNKFADLSNAEFVAMMTSSKYNASREKTGRAFNRFSGMSPPSSIDWRDYGCVTRVKDQGQCDASWAFSATGSLEGQHCLEYGVLVNLSAQNLLDCSSIINDCDGGYVDFAFSYIISNGGIDTERSYPYEGVEDICRFDPFNIGATEYSYTAIYGSEDSLELAVGIVGPVSVNIDASQPSFQLYESGVYDEEDCSTWYVNHALVVVGYDTDMWDGDYWIVKNSWGTDWGQDGYIWMSKDKDNQCGIASEAYVPLV